MSRPSRSPALTLLICAIISALPAAINSASFGDTGRATATFYGSGDGGNCGYGVLADSGYGPLIAAGSAPLYKNGKGCGACYKVRCVDSKWCKDAEITVPITDFCPGGGVCCPTCTHFDLSQPAFGIIADPVAGVIPLAYERVPCSFPTSITFRVTGTNYWMNVLLLRVGGPGEVSLVEVSSGNDANWRPLTHDWGTNWVSYSYIEGPLRFRLTSGMDGAVITTGENCVPAIYPGDYTCGAQFTSGYNSSDTGGDGGSNNDIGNSTSTDGNSGNANNGGNGTDYGSSASISNSDSNSSNGNNNSSSSSSSSTPPDPSSQDSSIGHSTPAGGNAGNGSPSGDNSGGNPNGAGDPNTSGTPNADNSGGNPNAPGNAAGNVGGGDSVAQPSTPAPSKPLGGRKVNAGGGSSSDGSGSSSDSAGGSSGSQGNQGSSGSQGSQDGQDSSSSSSNSGSDSSMPVVPPIAPSTVIPPQTSEDVPVGPQTTADVTIPGGSAVINSNGAASGGVQVGAGGTVAPEGAGNPVMVATVKKAKKAGGGKGTTVPRHPPGKGHRAPGKGHHVKSKTVLGR